MMNYKISLRMMFNLLIVFMLGCCCIDATKANNHFSNYLTVQHGKIFYQTFGSGDPIIVLHGGPGLDQSYLLPQMLELAQDHQVIFYDQRGSGKSDCTDMSPSCININQFVQDLEDIRKQLGIKKFIVLGHSWGGLLAMTYATKYPENLNAIILMNSAPADTMGMQAFEQEFSKRTKPIATQIKPLLSDHALEKASSSQIKNLDKILCSVYLYNPKDITKLTLNRSVDSIKNGAKVLKIMNETSSLKPEKLADNLKKLTIPTLIIHGQQDIVPIATAQKIHQAIPHSQFIAIEHCGHFAFVEQPQQTFSYIRNFLIEHK